MKQSNSSTNALTFGLNFNYVSHKILQILYNSQVYYKHLLCAKFCARVYHTGEKIKVMMALLYIYLLWTILNEFIRIPWQENEKSKS